MNPLPPSLEDELRALQATTLDEAFLSRLEAAADGTLTELTADEARFENQLRRIRPAPLEKDFLAGLETITAGVHFPVNEKIVLFPKGSAKQVSRPRRSMWGAAAAVALIGGLSALMFPTTLKQQSTARATPENAPSFSQNSNSNLVPASFGRGLKEVHEEGVIWKANKPHRVMRVEYNEQITLKGADGRIMEVEQPRVEYMLVPAQTD